MFSLDALLPPRAPEIGTGSAPLLSERWIISFALIAWFAAFNSILIWDTGISRMGPPEGNTQNFYRIFLVLFAGAASGYLLARDPRRWVDAFPGPLVLLVIYAVTALLSSAYIPTYAMYSLWKSFEILVDVLVMAAILSYANNQEGARTTYRILIAIDMLLVMAYVAEIWIYPNEALQPSRGIIKFTLVGVIPVMQENALAFLGAVTAFGSFCRLFRPAVAWKWLLYAAILSLSLLVLVMAQSRTSFVGFLIAVTAYLLFDRRFKIILALTGLAVLGGVYASLSDIFFQYLLRGQDPELVRSFSGRTQGWEAALAAFQEAPLLGHGFAAYARAVILSTEGVTSMHGAVFEVMVGTGAVGLMAWGGAIIWTMIRLVRLPASGHPWFSTRIGRSTQAEMIGIAALILVRGTTSSGLAEHEDNFLLFLTLLAYTASMHRASSAQDQGSSRTDQCALESR